MNEDVSPMNKTHFDFPWIVHVRLLEGVPINPFLQLSSNQSITHPLPRIPSVPPLEQVSTTFEPINPSLVPSANQAICHQGTIRSHSNYQRLQLHSLHSIHPNHLQGLDLPKSFDFDGSRDGKLGEANIQSKKHTNKRPNNKYG